MIRTNRALVRNRYFTRRRAVVAARLPHAGRRRWSVVIPRLKERGDHARSPFRRFFGDCIGQVGVATRGFQVCVLQQTPDHFQGHAIGQCKRGCGMAQVMQAKIAEIGKLGPGSRPWADPDTAR